MAQRSPCCRLVEHLITDREVLKAIDAGERFAAGRIKPGTLATWTVKVRRANRHLPVECSPLRRQAR